jgi:urea transporter
MCGASPVGWVVVVAGTAAYIVTDTAIFAVKEVVKVPTVAEDAIPYILNGWKETAWQPS